jgi:hypothetical protein
MNTTKKQQDIGLPNKFLNDCVFLNSISKEEIKLKIADPFLSYKKGYQEGITFAKEEILKEIEKTEVKLSYIIPQEDMTYFDREIKELKAKLK